MKHKASVLKEGIVNIPQRMVYREVLNESDTQTRVLREILFKEFKDGSMQIERVLLQEAW
jgi:hypothetical protein